jgi:hypothetical protein
VLRKRCFGQALQSLFALGGNSATRLSSAQHDFGSNAQLKQTHGKGNRYSRIKQQALKGS